MKIIGITGGVGSGKSRVLHFLEEEYQAVICQADHVAWELQMLNEACYNEIVQVFGEEILNADKTIDRKKLGFVVFADERKLKKLNEIMHPSVKTRILERIEHARAARCALFVVEAALLLEENYGEICDELWYIYCDEKTRRVRLKESRMYSDEKISAIMANQLSEEVFREHCKRVIDNSGSFEDTCKQIRRIYEIM